MLAEDVLEAMRERGAPPSRVAWLVNAATASSDTDELAHLRADEVGYAAALVAHLVASPNESPPAPRRRRDE